mmetsp:Transcript_2312/g.3171  ORF Transcript_2312/g.3171 Transcript_2312/m.3171 type:complete len:184 (+) Transcript_2312:510-1061(+)
MISSKLYKYCEEFIVAKNAVSEKLVKAVSQHDKKELDVNEIKFPHIMKGYIGDNLKEWYYEVEAHQKALIIVGAKKQMIGKINFSAISLLVQKVEEVERQQRKSAMSLTTSMLVNKEERGKNGSGKINSVAGKIDEHLSNKAVLVHSEKLTTRDCKNETGNTNANVDTILSLFHYRRCTHIVL